MTKPKRWPKRANEHKTDAIFAAGAISKKIQAAKLALRGRNLDEVLIILRDGDDDDDEGED